MLSIIFYAIETLIALFSTEYVMVTKVGEKIYKIKNKEIDDDFLDYVTIMTILATIAIIGICLPNIISYIDYEILC